MQEAYKILNSSPNDSIESIKHSYRTLAKQYHYDTLHSKELPKELLDFANKMMQKINLAFEIIKKSRGL